MVVLGAVKSFAEPVSLSAQGFVLFRTVYDLFRYEAGCKIEEKVVIKTITFKDGHGIESIKRTYSAESGAYSFCDTLENSERVF
jgi:hypothetical protein